MASMGQPKPLASLSSSLLARKGHAKPAMRPQGFAGFGAGSPPGSADDLGWNDMGLNEPSPEPVAIPRPVEAAPPLPPVLVQREELKEEVEARSVPSKTRVILPRSAQSVPSPRKRQSGSGGGNDVHARDKAAFTLRLNGDRHLRLRLASALCNRSSQQLVTEALDKFLRTLPEVEAMASRLVDEGNTDIGDGG